MAITTTLGVIMGNDDKADNKIEEIRGKAKEAVGNATGDEALEHQGERDQSKANLKQAGEKVKDAYNKYPHNLVYAAGPPLRWGGPARAYA
jgi:uncharacterized protein YjbJ (UPF0337 family)